MKKKRWLPIVIVVLVILLLFPIVGLRGLRAGLPAKDNKLNVKNYSQAMLMTVEKGEVEKTITCDGYASALQDKQLYFALNGKVARVNVTEGQHVEKNASLLELENKQQQLSYLQAKDNYDLAKINGSDSQINQAKLQLDIAADVLADTVLKAPFAGTVTDVFFKTGDYVPNGQPIAKIVDDSGYQIDADVDESDIHQIALGQGVKVTFESLPGQQFTGVVSKKGSLAQNINGAITIPVTVTLKGKVEGITPGCSAQLEIMVGKLEGALAIPSTAIFTTDGKDYVMKVAGNKLTPVEVKTGLNNGARAVVESGLAQGDRILINSYEFAGIDPTSNMFQNGRMGHGMGQRGGN